MTGIENSNDRILDLISDDVARTILTATDGRAMTAQMLQERCDASLATIYRRIEELLEHRLLRERTEIRTDGNHHRTFVANLDRFAVTLQDGDLAVDVERQDDAPDRFRSIWDAMQTGWE